METKTKEKFTLRKSKKYKNLVSVGLGLFFVTTGGLFLTTSQADAKEQTPVQEKQEIKDTGSIEVNIKKSEEFKTAINQAQKEGVDIKPKAEKENLGIVKNIGEAKQLEQVAKDKENYEKENVEKEIQDYKSKKEKYQKELEKVTNENEKRKKENEQIRKDNEQAIIDNERKNKDIDEYNKREEERYKREKAIFDRKMQKAKENSHKTGYLSEPTPSSLIFKSEPFARLTLGGNFSNYKSWGGDHPSQGGTFNGYDWVTATYTNLKHSSYAGRKISKVVYKMKRATAGNNPMQFAFYQDPCYGVWAKGDDGNGAVTLEIRFYDEDGDIITFSPEAPAMIGLSSLTSGHINEHGNPIQFWETITDYNFKFIPINGSYIKEYDNAIKSTIDNLYPEYDGCETTPKNDTPTDPLFYKFGGGGKLDYGSVIRFNLKYLNPYETTIWNTISTEVAGYTELPEYVVPPRYLQKSATKPKPEKELLKEPKKPETPIIRYTEYKYEIKPQIEKEVKNSENQNINNRQTIKGAEVNFNLKTEILPKNREQINVFQITDTLPQNYKINLEKTKSLNKNFLIDYSKGQITFTASKQTLEKINDIEKDITPPAPTIYGNITNDETTIINEFNLNINNKYKTHSNTVKVKTPEKAESSKDVELDGELEKNTNKEKVEPKKEEKEKVEPTEKEEKRKISVKITDPSNTLSEKDRIKTFEEAETGIYKKTGELIEIKKGANLEFEVEKDFEGYIKPFKVPAGYIYNGNGHKIKAVDTNNGQINISIPLEKSHDAVWEFPKPQLEPHIRKKRSLANAPTKEETPNNIIKTLKKQLQPKEAKAEEIKEAKAGKIKEENKKQITENINFDIKPKYKTETIEEMNINTIYVLDTSGSRDEIIGKTAELTKKWFDSMKGFKTNVYQYDEKDRINKFMPKYFNKNGEIIATEKEKESFGRIENPVKQLTKEQGHNLLIFETDFIDQAMSKGINTYGNWREEKSSRVREATDEMINEFYKINKTQTLLILDGANEIFGGNNLPHKVIDEQTGEIKGIVIDSMQDRSTTLTKTVENLVDKYKVEVPQPKKYDIEVEKDKDIDVTLTIDGQQITNSYEIKKPVAETKTLNIQAKAPKELETNKTVTVKIYEVNQGKKEEVGRKTITFKAKKQPNKNSVNGKKIIEGSTLKYKLLWDLDQYQDIAVTKEEINKGFYYIDDYPEEAVDPQIDKVKITDSEGKAVEGIENKIYKNINEAPKELQNLLAKEGIKPKGAFQLFSVKDKEKFFRDYVSKGKTLTITTPMQVKRHFVGEIKNKAYQIDFGNGYQTNEVGNKVEKVEPKKENKNKDGQKIDGKKVLEGSTSYYNLTWDLDQYQDIAVTKEEINKGFYYIDDYPEEAVDPEPGNIKITDSEGKEVEGIENKIYKNLNEAPKELQNLLAKEGIKPKGAFQVFSVKDKEKFFKNYVEKGKTLTITTPMKVKRHYVGNFKNKAYQIDFGNGYQTNEVGNRVEKVEPKKENKNKDGQKIDGKKVLEGSTSYYNLTWDLDQYKDIAVTKEEINKGFYYIDDFPEDAVDPHPENITITDSDGNKVDGIENKIYKNISEAPKDIQDLLAKEGIKPKGAFQLFSVKDKEKFFRDYVSKGKTLTITTPMQVKRHYVGEIKNKAYQIDFGNGYQTNEVGNKVEKVEPKKDVELDGEIIENGGEVELNKTFNYRLRGAIIPENRGTKLEDYEFIDDYDEIHDEYLGNYRVILTDDVSLKDGKIIKKGEDITNYTEQKINKEQGKVEIKIKPQFLDKISDNSKFSAQALLPMKRIKDGEVENTYINKINGVETKSNTIKTKTKPLPKTKAIPKKEEKEKPQEKALPKTGVAEKDNIKEISLITLLGVGTLYLRRKRKINK